MKKVFAVLLAALLLLSGAACAEKTGEMTLSAPNGAPAIAVAGLALENPEAFTFVDAETIAAEFANATHDFIIAPVNAGAKLFKAGKSTYRLAAVITWGNLVFASQKKDFSLESINGSALTLFGENTINASVARYVLEKKEIQPASTEYLAGAANTQQLLLSDPEAVVLTAEPAVTAAKIKNEAVTSIALNEVLGEITGVDGFTQAGLFVKEETLKADAAAVDAYLERIRQAADMAVNDLETLANASVELGILPNAKVAVSAIPNCGIRYVSAAEAKEWVAITAGMDLSQFGGEVPSDDFYYAGE